MPAFSRVQGPQAGPAALGILVPPGRRTVVVVRPRALEWDLLPLAPLPMSESPFWEVSRDQAEDLVRRVAEALEAGGGRVEPLASPAGQGYQVRAAIGPFVLLACRRDSGQPYRPDLFETVADAQAAATRIANYLCPAAHAEQELYINTRNFARQQHNDEVRNTQ